MSIPSLLQYAVFIVVVTLLVYPLGKYLFYVFNSERTLLHFVLAPVERFLYRIGGINPDNEMDWREYSAAFVLFSIVGILVLFLILLAQPLLPWYSTQGISTPMTVDLALNTAVSFATTTTWQAYGGEATMSHAAQILGLAAQNFLAGASGLAVGIGFIRGLARRSAAGLGNFWADTTRAVLYVLLPLALIGGLLLVWQGVPMNVAAPVTATTLQGDTQTIPQGPVAALEIIKNLGTAGGGFFNVNGAHPYANPTPLTNILTLLAIVALPAALTHTFGRMIGSVRHGWVIYGIMLFFFIAGLGVTALAEANGNPSLTTLGASPAVTEFQPGGNMEGKELRFGIHGTALAVVTTSNAATGSVNAMHASLMPLSAFVTLFNMLLGEIVFGGLGTGIYSIIMLVLISLFIGGLMVGRTPEYLGKKITGSEIKLVAIYILMAPIAVLILTALALMTEAGLAGIAGDYPQHGFTAILYAYTTSFANNGQNFANLSANTPFYNVTTVIAMLLGRFGLALPALALAGVFARQGYKQPSVGTLPINSLLFAGLVVIVAVVVGALSFLPALALGPLVDQFLLGS